MGGMIAAYRGFLLISHRDRESESWHCFIGIHGDHPMSKIPAPVIWDNGKIKIERIVWSSMDGPMPDGRSKIDSGGFIKWFGFDGGLAWDETLTSSIDVSMKSLQVSADVLMDSTYRICGDEEARKWEESDLLIAAGEQMARGLMMRWERDLSWLGVRIVSLEKEISKAMELFEWNDE